MARRKKSDEDPPYLKYALVNPYNLSLLAGAGVASAATGQWWVGVAAAVVETVWLLFAPDSAALQKAWFDKLWADEKMRRVTEVRDAKFKKLQEGDQQRAQIFWDALRRIEQLAKENPSLTADLVQSELVKLDGLYDDFLDLAIIAGQGEAHLSRIDYGRMNALWSQYQAQLKSLSPSDKRREIAEKNIEVLEERRRRIDELAAKISNARGQMDLLDNTARLLGDEIVAMTTPSELGDRLDELRLGVSTIRETTRDVDAVYAELEDELRAQEQAQRAGHR
ncbi:MAG: hypothetical protein U0235_08215 [Polyangiaceae bacterium]